MFKKYFRSLATTLLIASTALAGDAVIFSGNDVLALKQNLDLNRIAKILTGTADPTSVAQGANKGSIYLRTGASGGTAYLKQDNGSSTNWTAISMGGGGGDVAGPASSTDNAVVRFDSTTGKVIQNSGATLSDADLLTTANLILSGTTATTVPYLNGSKQITSSSVTPTELGYVSGVTSAIQTQLGTKQATITATSSADYYRGDKTFQTLNTAAVPELTNLYYTAARFDTAFAGKTTSDLTEGSNKYYTTSLFNADLALKTTSDLTEGTRLYYTDARAIAAPLTGYVSGAGTVSSSDSLLQAVQKLNGNFAARTDLLTLTGDVAATGPTSTATIQSNVVSNAKLAQMAQHTFKGNNTGSTANALDLTATQLTAELNNVVGDSGSGGTKGLVPAPSSGDAAAGKFLKADGTWVAPSAGSSSDSSYELSNLGLATSVSANAMTVALKQKSGSDASSGTSSVFIGFRNSTAATGTYAQRAVTAALSVVIPSGATLGLVSAQNQYIWVYGIDNAGTVELAVAGARIFDEGSLQSTVAITSGSTSKRVLYSTTLRSNVAVRLLGRIQSNQTASGTYAANSTEIKLAPLPPPTYRCNLILTNGLSNGSTNTKVRTYSTTLENNGDGECYTYANSATLGMSVTVNRDGLYAVHVQDVKSSGGADGGISVNSNQLTTSISSITSANVVCSYTTANAGFTGGCDRTRFFAAGDVIRAHDNGVFNDTTGNSRFELTRIGD